MGRLTAEVAVIGAGVIGRSIAWRLASEGLHVRLIDAHHDIAASKAAAGMLGVVGEASPGEESLLDLLHHAAVTYPQFVANVEGASNRSIGFLPSGTIILGLSRSDTPFLDTQQRIAQRYGLRSGPLSPQGACELEPALARPTEAFFAPDDHQVDSRKLLEALQTACQRTGVDFNAGNAVNVESVSGGGTRIVLADDSVIDSPTTVLACGAWLPLCTTNPELQQLIRPVKGEAIRLRARGQVLSHVVRGWANGRHVYIVDRRNGEIVIGASSYEAGYDPGVRARSVHELLADAGAMVPELFELKIAEISVGIRPATRDNAPLVGPVEALPDCLVAVGHYRHGVLLAGVTSEAIARYVLKRPIEPVWRNFLPERFHANTGDGQAQRYSDRTTFGDIA